MTTETILSTNQTTSSKSKDNSASPDLSFVMPIPAAEIHAALAEYIKNTRGLSCKVNTVTNQLSAGIYSLRVTPQNR